MTRLAVFLVLSLFLIMALLPFRINALAEYGHPYAAGEQEFYFTSLAELEQLKREGAAEEAVHKAMLKVAKSLSVLRRYQAADRLYREVWQARSKSSSAYDETFVSAVIGLAGLRRDTSNVSGAVSCYSAALAYDKRHLPKDDIRLTRDKTNLAVALLLASKTASNAEKKTRFLKLAAGYLSEGIAEQQARSPRGSLREANARQDLAYALRDMGDRQGYEKEMRLARTMQRRLNSFAVCREP
jgi:hypothetical protein